MSVKAFVFKGSEDYDIGSIKIKDAYTSLQAFDYEPKLKLLNKYNFFPVTPLSLNYKLHRDAGILQVMWEQSFAGDEKSKEYMGIGGKEVLETTNNTTKADKADKHLA
jgi:hypothetical protein